MCDLLPWPVGKHHLETRCVYCPRGGTVGAGGSQPLRVAPSRQLFRRRWFASERSAQRVILCSLTCDANSDCEIDENVVDNRHFGR